MAPKSNRHSDEEWLSRRTEIRELFMEKGLTLLAVTQHLESQGFPVSKSQLEYKLKAWGFKKKLPKKSSQAGWQYIRHHVEKRKNQGKESEVVLSGVRIDQQTVEREINRHHSSAWSGSFHIATSPRTPEGFPVSIRTPAALIMAFNWHNSLPRIQLQQQANPTVTTPIDLLDKVNVTASPLILIRSEDFGSLQSNTIPSASSSTLSSVMPKSHEGENFSCAEIVVRGPSNEATQEHVNVAIFKLSDKLHWYTDFDWEQTLEAFETSGIMSTGITLKGVQLNQHSDGLRTMSALAEELYQDAFDFLYHYRNYEAPENLQARSVKLLKWLLDFGYCPDTYPSINLWHSTDVKATGLQLAIHCKYWDLACALLDAGANPNLKVDPTHRLYPHHFDLPPPFVMAMSCSPSPGKNATLRSLVDAGADTRVEPEREFGFVVEVSVLSTLIGFSNEEGGELQEMMDVLRISEAKFVTADVLISAAWHGKMRNLELLLEINPDVNVTNAVGLTALHAAAYQGHKNICIMLLQRGSHVDCSDQGVPSPLHLASYRKHVDIIAMLFQHVASLRGITITEDDYAVVFSRYVLVKLHDKVKEDLRPWVEVRRFALRLETPGGAAVHAFTGNSGHLAAHLLQHGAILSAAALRFLPYSSLPPLLFHAFQKNLDLRHCGPDDFYPLQRTMSNGGDPEEPGWIECSPQLLDAGTMAEGREAVLGLQILGSWDLVERILSSYYGDISKAFTTLYDRINEAWCLPFRIGTTLLETAILAGSATLIEYVLARNPSEYSAGALCAATLQAAEKGNTLALLERLLQNRAKLPSTQQEDPVCETTAIGIAAWSGNSAILEILHTHIPVSHLAYLPNGDSSVKLASTVANPSLEHGAEYLSFWHEARYFSDLYLVGSPLNFALDRPKILDQLLRYGYKLDRISLAMMADLGDTTRMRSLVQGRHILYNQHANRIHRPLYHAITNGDLEMLTLLFELGEDINDNESGIVEKFGVGRSPLARAIEIKNLSLIELLLKAGADVNVPPARLNGRTALQCAAAQDLLGIAKQLIDLGADVNAGRCEMDGLTALEAAVHCRSPDMVQLLLSEGLETTGNGRQQYVTAIQRASWDGPSLDGSSPALLKILKEHRPWTDEDQLIWDSQPRSFLGIP